MKNLSELRKELDALDEKLVSLYLERLRISREIGDLKKENGTPVGDSAREAEILERLSAAAGDDAPAVRKLYETVFETSREIQK